MKMEKINRARAVSLYLAIALFISFQTFAQSDSTTFAKKRKVVLIGSAATAYTVTMVGLNEAWYKNSPRESFHFFNDGAEWNQVDKVGHAFSTFHLNGLATHSLKWAGYNDRQSLVAGSISSFLIVSSIEIFDGFSSAYGASVHDLGANAIGSSLFLGQQFVWKEVRIHPKFSFQQSQFAAMRPAVLGKTWTEQILKDYNGQTYWLSVDMDKFMHFPKWLNLAVGYGAEEMVYATRHSNNVNGFNPYRQFYFSLDLDPTAIRTKSKLIKAMLYFANMIKIPSPAIEFSQRGVKWHAMKF